jgi:tRNA (mo5U34)-methyltransferase
VADPSAAGTAPPGSPGLAREVVEKGPWYHTFDLPGGVSTAGFYDLRSVTAKVGLPGSLAGGRCLDAAACEGFWSFELARRGATEVVSVDLPDTSEQDWQGELDQETLERGSGMANDHFRFVRETLGFDNVQRVDMNIYDVAPERLGSFDFVFVGNILVHLSDAPRALRALRSVLAPGGTLISLEPTSLALSVLSPRIPLGQLWDIDDQPRWWTPNIAAHRRLLHAAGFELLARGGPILQPFGAGMPARPTQRPRTAREWLYWYGVRRIGVPSSWIRARSAAPPDQEDLATQKTTEPAPARS